MLGLPACSSFFGTSGTPTPSRPTPTPAPPTATPPPLAAIVNNEFITQAEFEAELDRYRSAQQALGRAVSDGEAGQTVLEDLVAQVLLSQAARAEGFDLTEGMLRAREEALAAQIGGEAALSQWKSDHHYTDESFHLALKRAVEAAWMRDKIIADVPETAEQVHIRQILTYNQETADRVLQQLNSGADFDELALLYDPNTRGELGWVPRGYLLDAGVEEAAFSLEVGAYSEVIQTPAGFHILTVLERDPRHPLSPDALLTMQEQALQAWLQNRREQSDIDRIP